MSVNTLAYWKYRRRIAGEARSPVFVPVKLADDLHGVRSELVVEICGARLCIPRGGDLDQVARVLELLRRPC